MKICTGIVGVTGRLNSYKSMSVSASDHTLFCRLRDSELDLARQSLGRQYAYLSEDSEGLDFLASLGNPWSSVAHELRRAHDSGVFYKRAKYIDPNDDSKIVENIQRGEFDIGAIAVQIETNSELQNVSHICDLWNNPEMYALAARSSVGLAIQTEQLEYERREQYAYLNLEAIPSVDKVRWILSYNKVQYGIKHWGVLAIVMGVYRPTLVSSWDTAVMMPAELQAFKLTAQGGFNMTQGVALSALSSLLIEVNSTWIAEIRIDSGKPEEEVAAEIRHAGYIRMFIALLPAKTHTINNRPVRSDEVRVPTPEIEFFRYKGTAQNELIPSVDVGFDIMRGHFETKTGEIGKEVLHHGYAALIKQQKAD